MYVKQKHNFFVAGCAPPPGSYNPKFGTKLIGGVLSKTQRFLEPAEESASVLNTSKGSIKSTDEKTVRKIDQNNTLWLGLGFTKHLSHEMISHLFIKLFNPLEFLIVIV